MEDKVALVKQQVPIRHYSNERWLVLMGIMGLGVTIGISGWHVVIVDIFIDYLEISLEDYNLMCQCGQFGIISTCIIAMLYLDRISLKSLSYFMVTTILILIILQFLALTPLSEDYKQPKSSTPTRYKYIACCLAEFLYGCLSSLCSCLIAMVLRDWFPSNEFGLVFTLSGIPIAFGNSLFMDVSYIVDDKGDIYKLRYFIVPMNFIGALGVLIGLNRSNESKSNNNNEHESGRQMQTFQSPVSDVNLRPSNILEPIKAAIQVCLL